MKGSRGRGWGGRREKIKWVSVYRTGAQALRYRLLFPLTLVPEKGPIKIALIGNGRVIATGSGLSPSPGASRASHKLQERPSVCSDTAELKGRRARGSKGRQYGGCPSIVPVSDSVQQKRSRVEPGCVSGDGVGVGVGVPLCALAA